MQTSPEQILAQFVELGLIDGRSRVQTHDDEVDILYLRAAHPHEGAGRRFLQALKQAGLHVHIVHPTFEALPFWRRMNAEHLVDDDPDRLRTWDDYIDTLECQMGKPGMGKDERG